MKYNTRQHKKRTTHNRQVPCSSHVGATIVLLQIIELTNARRLIVFASYPYLSKKHPGRLFCPQSPAVGFWSLPITDANVCLSAQQLSSQVGLCVELGKTANRSLSVAETVEGHVLCTTYQHGRKRAVMAEKPQAKISLAKCKICWHLLG